mmetsp:Transcript_10493/g.34463  ORF Transcript_10493/g.34463 Transcript_10493/m.34463 type:complete len:519 (-) Transcript_10493:54-1610(-)
MTSTIARLLGKVFGGKVETRLLMLGLDASGRTTALYKIKFGEVMTTIPTIGFNVDTIEYKKTSFTFWDVGGCDKIRPLWRHYFKGTHAICYFVDSIDHLRFAEALSELEMLLSQPELACACVLVWANKQDLEGAMPVVEVEERVREVMEAAKWSQERWTCMGAIATEGIGLYEGLDWLLEHICREQPMATASEEASKATPETEEEVLLTEWLQREDDPADVFLCKFGDYSLESWDHYTHLRVAWLLLRRHGRREGMKRIFDGIRSFIANSKRTQRARGTTFHETMTYFWVHMVDYAMASQQMHGQKSGDEGDAEIDGFKKFLLLNPQLSNGGLFLHYYSKRLMLQTPDSRTQVVLPDVRPLPSLLSSTTGGKGDAAASPVVQPNAAPLSDDEWLLRWESRELPAWGHEARLRLIWLKLTRLERRDAVRAIFDELAAFEGAAGHHVTLAYFWIHMVTACIAREGEKRSPTYALFARQPPFQFLRNVDHTDRFYSQKQLYSDRARTEFVPPDLKPLPAHV